VHELSERATRAYEDVDVGEAFHQCRKRTRDHFRSRNN
jgi:hypothetical protein